MLDALRARHPLRCLTTLFGHAGLEWDLNRCDAAELEVLTGWSALYRELRPPLHTGDVVRADHPDPGVWVHGVRASPDAVPGRLRLPGLDPDRRYRVRVRHEVSAARACSHRSCTPATGCCCT